MTVHRLAAVLCAALLLTACPPRHKGGPNTPHGNDMIMNEHGIPSFGGPVQRCPGPNPDGEIELSYEDGQKRVAGTCKGGVMVGDWTAWYTNGAVIWRASFEHGRLAGKFRSYYANDRRWAEAEFHLLLHGEIEVWHPNGKKWIEGRYFMGDKVDCWETWHDNGQKASEGPYAHDRQVGTWRTWTASGQKREQKLGGETSQGDC